MIKVFKIIGVVIGTVLFLALLVMQIWPMQSARAMLWGHAMSAGLQRHDVATDSGVIHYLEGGEGPTVLLLHGIYARKEHWVDFSRQLLDRYHVIIPDLPGFGDNLPLGDGGYIYDQQAANILRLMDALGIETAHLAANSMGGQIAGLVATGAPARVRSVAFIGSPVGVKTDTPSDLDRATQAGALPMVVDSRAAFDRRSTYLFPRKPFVPPQVEALWAQEEIARGPTNRRIWDEVNSSNRTPLLAIAPQIKQPGLVLWCKQDRVFHPEGAKILMDALPEAELVLLEDCGHIPMLDQPAASGRALRTFLDRFTTR